MGGYGVVGTTPPTKISRAQKDREVRRNNSMAYVGLVLSLVAVIVNPVAVLSILGIVFSAIGLARSNDLEGRHRVTGRGTAVAGLVVGLVVTVYFFWRVTTVLN
jgi:hypothetical protein